MGRVLHFGPSWHGPRFMWAELAGAKLVLGRVVLHTNNRLIKHYYVFCNVTNKQTVPSFLKAALSIFQLKSDC